MDNNPATKSKFQHRTCKMYQVSASELGCLFIKNCNKLEITQDCLCTVIGSPK